MRSECDVFFWGVGGYRVSLWEGVRSAVGRVLGGLMGGLNGNAFGGESILLMVNW